MKQFFGAFFGSIIGLLIATTLAIVIVVGIAKSSFNSAFKQDKESASVSKSNAVLRLVVEGQLDERTRENPFSELGGPFAEDEGLGLSELLVKIREAKNDADVKGIFLDCKHLETGFASLTELRNALSEFRKSGKFIYAYSEDYGQREYFLASVANKVFLNPQGNLDWRGLNMSLLFFQHAFEKLDIEMQVFRHGKFKSAVEPFLMDKMSAANRFQSETFLNSIWASLLADIARDRKISTEDLNGMADRLEIQFPEDALRLKFIDAVAYEDEVLTELKKKIGLSTSDKLKFTDLSKYNTKARTEKTGTPEKIAVVFATGNISSGEGDNEEIGSERLAKTLREARLDNKIKGIVLRVNSPGGSALASDVIWREVLLASKTKPTVVSMGDVAASGGYYISCAAQRIFAQPNTITGSIGVFGLIPNVQKALEKKLGITVDTVNTNKYSDIATGLRPVTEYEYKVIQNSVERVYDVFTKRVAEGRKLSQADVDSIGQGRVWTGSDAMRIGLVDEMGGLDDAVAWVAKKAKLGTNIKRVELPRQKGPFDGLFGKKENELESRIARVQLGPAYTYFRQLRQLMSLQGIQTRLPFEMVVK